MLKNITHISSRYHPDITHISSRYHPDITHISSKYHPVITHISSRYHPHIIQISSKYHPVNIDFYSVKSRVFTQIWYVVCRQKLHFEFRLKLHFSSSRYYPNIIQITSRNHPEIIQISPTYHPHIIQISPTYHPDITHISSRYHPHIIQISSKDHPVNIDFYLVKSRVFTQIWYVVCRWKLHFQTRLKLHFWKAKVEFYSSFTRVSVCWELIPFKHVL